MRKLIVAAALLFAACATAPIPPPPVENGAARERWLYEQRAYPFDAIPADGRRNALRAVQRARIAGDAVEGDVAAQPSWRAVGPLPVFVDWPWLAATGRVKALAVSRVNPDIVLAGSSSGGIWRSTDAGRNFAPVSDDQADLAVGAIAFAPSSPDLVYATMGSDFLGTGVLRSDDAGAHWRLVSGPTFGTRGATTRIVVHPTNPERLWVAQYSRLAASGSLFSSGVLESADGGVTWARRFAGLPSDLVALPGGTTLLAGLHRVDQAGGGSPGVYRSTDGGQTWTQVLDLVDDNVHPRLGITPAAPQRVYAYSIGYTDEGPLQRFVASEDGGLTWSDRAAKDLPKHPAVFVSVDPANPNVVYVGMYDLYRSLDGGQTFVNVTRGYTPEENFDPAHSTSHVDQHSLAFHPLDASTFYLGNDGGVFLSHDRGTSFESLSGTLSLVQAYGIAAHPTDPAVLYLGAQDNGLERRGPDGRWRELLTGDYGSIVFDNDDPAVFFANYVYDAILAFRGDRYAGYANSPTQFSPGPYPFIAPFEHLRSTNGLYFGTWRLFRSADFGRTWTAPAGELDLTKGDGDTLSAIAVSEHVLYTGSSRGRVMRSHDDGATWTDVTKGLPDRSARAIAIHGDVVYVGFSGYATDHVFVTRDGGTSWQPLREGLPDIPVNALLLRKPYLYAGTDIGVFRWDGERWTYVSQGMPPVIVTDFAVTADGRVVAATHGRGAYELVLPPTTRRRGVRH
ncbi:MAG TPA: hypothetical protein VFP80_00225 [Thermoanaerobaculia bacterium]|nr:hypothetical protein [Thermoanaerobaculia bacterium]